jgi:hypothetical protein
MTNLLPKLLNCHKLSINKNNFLYLINSIQKIINLNKINNNNNKIIIIKIMK